ncbi:catalytic domain of components of various dehydrogenase complexes (plasmid) [Novosphingobium aromaticivorans DSM 12444]|uniref:Dihydrolipoamide acetyltransferase component of pyruvate dehydrogenase complex n=1 Tax=Novosphingobium aromaticivorans (strain ATCC 700278 / DSM 12444 / CCUG 56034 / CIP 105152 / NBRC 16084 / F199) TaxID=279238 RepID=A4XEQ9_NOVAD|nr:dihydrolipoamide acetyltransferase family protein [Novosphingobium aromaticivorans]ABP64420.1 catalytic domain of components of various dehydrogenase complexes [Novosphingobium aromaticivorans DSM 12444]SCY90861.1 pyruvate dehydrogenase E2 component (dihydrolipoamide acetyltransferase) [Novosphingobium aromaticivorans]
MANIRPFCMPKWGIEMTEGTIAEWMVKEGEAFNKGQVLCLIETAKITNEVEAEYDAVLKRLLTPASDEAHPVGALLAVFADADTTDAEVDEFIAGFKPAETSVAAKSGGGSAPAPAPAAAAPAPAAPARTPTKIVTNRAISPEALKLAEAEGVDIEPIEGSGRNGRITYQDVVQALRPERALSYKGSAQLVEDSPEAFASPLARRIAAQHGIALAGIKGTGARGRISKADVMALVKPTTAAAPVFGAPFELVANQPQVQPFDKVRKVVARRLTEAKQTIPHFYLRVSASVDALMDLRKTANLVLGTKASINDYLVKAVALALVRHPDVNVQVHGDSVHSFPHADVAIAVASPKGLVTPIVRQADRMHIAQIAATTRALIDKAQAGRLGYEDMDGGTFSVSNLGMFGIEQFDAIINPPQGAILAVGGVNRVAVEAANGDIAFENRIQLTMSVDHRAIDGAAGAKFLQTLKGLLEAPEGLFA